MIEPSPDAGWWVAAAALLLNIVKFRTGRSDAAKKKDEESVRAIAQAEIGARFGGENGFDARIARVEERVNGVYERVSSLDRKFDIFVGSRLAEEQDREGSADRT